MSDIELVIKIPEWQYKSICEGVEASKRCGVVGIDPNIHEAIYNGTPLDKHDEEVIAETVESIWGKPPYMDMLDKIRAEIEELTSRYSISKERGGMGQVEWSDRLIKESDVLQIIDKYRGEVDCRECKAEYECYECEKYGESEDK